MKKYLFFILLFVGCKSSHFLGDQGLEPEKYVSCFDKEQSQFFKKDFSTLYRLLEEGHFYRCIDCHGENRAISYELYKYLQNEMGHFCNNNYLSNINNFITIFGTPSNRYETTDLTNISYFFHVVNDPCRTCNHDGFGVYFFTATGEMDCP